VNESDESSDEDMAEEEEEEGEEEAEDEEEEDDGDDDGGGGGGGGGEKADSDGDASREGADNAQSRRHPVSARSNGGRIAKPPIKISLKSAKLCKVLLFLSIAMTISLTFSTVSDRASKLSNRFRV
jgi:hypothetical protein